ncbi:MAG: hypothetical protein WC831_01840 [Parcubacteria group bacterium]
MPGLTEKVCKYLEKTSKKTSEIWCFFVAENLLVMSLFFGKINGQTVVG